MSLVFNDTVTYRGIVQEYEKECGFEYGDVSGDAMKLATLVAGANLALDDFMKLAFTSEGTWQYDDSNQSDYPIITTNLVAGQRDYTFTQDADGNLLLDIYAVFVAGPNGIFVKSTPVDVSHGVQMPQGDRYVGEASGLLFFGGLTSFTDGQNTQGTPVRHDKLANGIFLDPIPSYSRDGGLKVYANREGSYFTSADTTKKPGVPGILHRYFVLRPAEDYLRRNNSDNYVKVRAERLQMEIDIQTYFSRRSKDERNRMSAGYQNNH